MSEEFADYPRLEWTPNRDGGKTGPSDLGAEFVSGPCWQLSAFGVCVDAWQNNRLTLGFYLAGVKIGQKTIHADDPCARIKADAGLAKVDAEICIDFGARHVIARGQICVVVACVRFNQVIFQF